MSNVLVVGSVALDSVETPFGTATDALGGSATFFSAAASFFAPVQLVGVIGDDFPLKSLEFLERRGVDLSGVDRKVGESFRWSGTYSYDLNTRETRETRLGVFANFQPVIPDSFRDAEWIFLGNIDPELQLDVLEQVRSPRLVACDTMNYWIEGSRADLMKLLGKVDILMANDGEIRQLAGEPNLVTASRWVQSQGPTHVVVKKGEHGAILFHEKEIFFVPGYPLEDLNDPTGAGDSFAGGFLGSLHGAVDLSGAALRRSSVFGSVLGSFAVEDFGVQRLARLSREEVAHRVRELRGMTQFDIH
jgi:sugar/nucleoside kinase (ribokinase family)